MRHIFVNLAAFGFVVTPPGWIHYYFYHRLLRVSCNIDVKRSDTEHVNLEKAHGLLQRYPLDWSE